MPKGKKGGRNSIPVSLVHDRREYEVRLKLAGMGTDTIVKQVNNEAANKGWGTVGRRTVEQDIANYFRVNRALSVQDYDHLDQLREAHLAQMELTIEKMAIHITTKNRAKTLYDKEGTPIHIGDWKPFEYSDALDKLHRMQMNYMEAQNWNKGRQNVNIRFQQNNINTIYEDATIEFKDTKPEAVLKFINDLKKVRNTLKDAEEVKK